MGVLTGKKGMILGVANDFSIAWAITQQLLAEGAELGFTHLPGDKMERRVKKLTDPIGAKLLTPCDVQKDARNVRPARFRAALDRIRADRRLEVSVRRLQP
jgi:enoyl-[acyl-carrier protein] reductase I